MSKKITPFLWFDQNAEEAVDLYRSLFDDVKVHGITRYPEGSPSPGTVITIDFEIAGQEVIALNGGPMYQFTEAFSFSVRADSQAEIDRLWEGLTANGGEPESVRLAQGPLRAVVADRAADPRRAAG